MERTKLRMPLQLSGEVSWSKTLQSQLRRIATRLFVGRFSRTWCLQHRIAAVFPPDLAKAMFAAYAIAFSAVVARRSNYVP